MIRRFLLIVNFICSSHRVPIYLLYHLYSVKTSTTGYIFCFQGTFRPPLTVLFFAQTFLLPNKSEPIYQQHHFHHKYHRHTDGKFRFSGFMMKYLHPAPCPDTAASSSGQKKRSLRYPPETVFGLILIYAVHRKRPCIDKYHIP